MGIKYDLSSTKSYELHRGGILMTELNHKHKSIILNVFEEYKDVMIQNGLYDSELQKGIEEVTNLLEDN